MNGRGRPKAAPNPGLARQHDQGDFTRLAAEVRPRLRALSTNLAHAAIGTVDWSEVGLGLVKLAMAAERQAEIAEAEENLRRAS